VSLLKQRASENGRSVEEEHRLILREALSGIPASTGSLSLEEYLIFDPDEDGEIPLTDREVPPVIQSL